MSRQVDIGWKRCYNASRMMWRMDCIAMGRNENMKKAGVVLMVIGLVLAACGLYGFYLVSHTLAGSLGLTFTEALAQAYENGSVAVMSFPQRLTLFVAENRLAVLIGGCVAMVAGCLMWFKDKLSGTSQRK